MNAAVPGVEVRLDYDSPDLAKTYDEASDAQFEHGKYLIAALAIKPGERVLDLGAGTGRLAAYVADIVGLRGRVTAVDPLPSRIELARAKGKSNVEAAIARAEDLSAFPNDAFDVVYLNSVFHWVGDKPRALAEIFRVLKRGGRLGLNTQDPNQPHQSRQFVQATLRETNAAADPEAAHPTLGISAAALRALVATAGFVAYEDRVLTLVDHLPDVDRLIAWSTASSFGNFLAGVDAEARARFRDALAAKIEPLRTEGGIRLERYLVFATAAKP